MRRFIDDLNHLGGQPIGMFLLICGITLSIVYAHWTIKSDIPDQLILAGALLLRQDAVNYQTAVIAPNATQQIAQSVNPPEPHP